MPATKIINVSKSDDFEDVFDLFKNTDAEDVIFIFPKGSRFVKQEQYFEAFKREADLSGKKVSVMTADPLVIQFASKYGFDILEARDPDRKKQQSADRQPLEPVEIPVEGELLAQKLPVRGEFAEPAEVGDIYPEPAGETHPEFAEGNYPVPFGERTMDEEPETILAAAGINEGSERDDRSRMIKDILPSRADHSLEVKEEKERTFEVDIKSHIEEPRGQAGDIERIWAEEEKRERRNNLFGSARKVKPSKLFKKMPLLLMTGAALVLILILFSTFGSAQLIIRPQKQKLDFKLEISASSTATAVNFDLNQIPGQRFKEQKEKSGTFPVSGQKDVVQKSSGKITIFNKSSASQRLVATTRFKSPDGLIFRIPQTITVPAALKAGIITTPGSVESVVYADRPGPEYNISPTQFTIPGFESTPKFNDFYAVSDKSMTGGIIGPAKVVTEEDFAKAQETLAAEAKKEILQSLESQSGELKILDLSVIKLEAPESNAKVGDAAENLQMSIKGLADTIAFRETDVIELIKNFVSQKNNVELLLKDLAINYVNPQAGADKTSLSFDAQVSGWAAAKLDTDAIKNDIKGMNEDSVRSYFQSIKEIESARIILSPFWVRSIPKDSEKIRIDIQTD